MSLNALLQAPAQFTPTNTKQFILSLSTNTPPSHISAFLTAFKISKKELDPLHVAALAEALLEICREEHGHFPAGDYVDIVGTGGDGQDTFNVSTAASIIAAACGLKVAKHGNRASSSKCGSADILESLSCNLSNINTFQKASRSLNESNFVFLFAQNFHKTMKLVSAVRKELGVSTIFNFLGPLINPSLPKTMIVGVHSKNIGLIMAEALKLSKHVERGMVVCGDIGLDEISPIGLTHTWSFTSSTPITYSTISPSDFGLPEYPIEKVCGGDPSHNANLLQKLLNGELKEDDPVLVFVLLNAAALLKVAGKVDNWKEGVEVARKAIMNGKAKEGFHKFRYVSGIV